MSPRATFGPRLRAHRERRGITLESIAQSTKIKLSMLHGLERSDVSRWPRGLFRRAYVRDYALAIGLDPQPVVAEFIRLFPEDGAVDPGGTGDASQRTAPPLRLNLATEPRDHVSRAASHVAAAAAEAVALLAVAGVVAFAAGTGFLATVGVVAIVYYPLAAACTGRTLQLAHLPLSIRRLFHMVVEQVQATRRQRLYLVSRQHQHRATSTAPGDDEIRPRRTAVS